MKKLLLITLLLAAITTASPQIITVLDSRSLKGKIDHKRTAPIIVEVTADGKLKYEKSAPSFSELKTTLDAEMDYRMPGERRVFVGADKETKFESIREILLVGRRIDVDDFEFVVDISSVGKDSIATKIVLEEPDPTPPKPGPLFLGVNVDKIGSITFNRKRVSDLSLVASLKMTFETRKKRRIFRQGSREVEKTVYLRVHPSTQYQEFLKILKLIRSSSAFPIAIEIDWLDK